MLQKTVINYGSCKPLWLVCDFTYPLPLLYNLLIFGLSIDLIGIMMTWVAAYLVQSAVVMVKML